MEEVRSSAGEPSVGAPLGGVDYEALGFRSGLEIHQQLLTERKLFCSCPARYVKGPHDAEIFRHMRPTLSELGEYDGTALMEFKTKKDVTYQIFHRHVCTYEFDDTPPFPLNQDALDIVIHLSLMFGCLLVNEVHVSRKQYLDGSIPAGFQRTLIVGIEGSVPFSEAGEGRTIGIIQSALEEDACREVMDKGHGITFRTDRLSIPLTEIVTHPDMRTPEEVRMAAEKLGRWMRSTGLVRRGLGATRQDVNVSVTGGTRVEIKGVPKLDWIPLLVHNEALRQWSLIELRGLLTERGLSADTLRTSSIDVTAILDGTECVPVGGAIAAGGRVGAVLIGKFRDLLDHPTQPGKTFSDELAGRVRVIACLDGRPNLLHMDQLPYQGMSLEEGEAIRSALDAGADDAVVITWGPGRDVDTALVEIVLRCRDAFQGVPSETRQAFPDGITDFERILPGPNRMYPDTDLTPTMIDDARVEGIRLQLTPVPDELEAMAIEAGVSPRIARSLAIHPRRMEFLEAVREGADPVTAAHVVVETLKALERGGIAVDRIPSAQLKELLVAIEEHGVLAEVVPQVITEMARGSGTSWRESFETMGLEPVDPETAKALIMDAMDETRANMGDVTPSCDAYMGVAMSKLRGRMSGSEVHRILVELLDTLST
jgi:glutamyl-tRNA(Gln) amidotransferase subunit E